MSKLIGFGDDAPAASPSGTPNLGYSLIDYRPLIVVSEIVAVGASAYHGYKRNNSIGWALWWGFMGALAPIVVVPIAVAQGFGEREK